MSKVIIEPDIEPVSLEEMLRHLKDPPDESENEDIDLLIKSARQWVEEYTGRALIDQTLETFWEEYPSRIDLLRPPVLDVVSFTYTDSAGAEQTLAANQYVLDSTLESASRIVPAYGVYWPSTRAQARSLRIRYRAGYADRTGSPQELAEKVPAPLRSAIKLIAAHLYTHRESVIEGVSVEELPMGVKFLCQPYRVSVF